MCKETVAWKKIDRDLVRPLILSQKLREQRIHPQLFAQLLQVYRWTLLEHFEQEALCKGIVENKDATTKY